MSNERLSCPPHVWSSHQPVHIVDGIRSRTMHASICQECKAIGIVRRVSNRKSCLVEAHEMRGLELRFATVYQIDKQRAAHLLNVP